MAQGTTRRDFLRHAAASVALTTIVQGLHYNKNGELFWFNAGFLPTNFVSWINSFLEPEKIRVKLAESKVYDGNSKVKRDVPYAEFRGTVFKFVPMDVLDPSIYPNDRSIGALSLVNRANDKYNPGKNIKGDLSYRALDLFNFFNNNGLIGKLEKGEVSQFSYKFSPAPIIRTGNYQVPVVTKYNSLDQIVSS